MVTTKVIQQDSKATKDFKGIGKTKKKPTKTNTAPKKKQIQEKG
jgi:hypothetical protein